MKQEAMVHMLPSDKPSKLFIGENTGLRYDSEGEVIKTKILSPQHLCFTTDEEIKEGDWVRHTNNDVGQVTILFTNNEYEMRLLNSVICGGMRLVNAKKIVATTNPELWHDRPYGTVNDDSRRINVPKIPLSFIKEYVEKQGKIEKVWLEYETKKVPVSNHEVITLRHPITDEPTNVVNVRFVDELVLNSDGSVSILPNEEKMISFSEVLNVAHRAFHHKIGVLPWDTISWDEWKREWFDKHYPQ